MYPWNNACCSRVCWLRALPGGGDRRQLGRARQHEKVCEKQHTRRAMGRPQRPYPVCLEERNSTLVRGGRSWSHGEYPGYSGYLGHVTYRPHLLPPLRLLL